MDTFLADLRHGIRLWRKAPLFAAITIGTLMLGIGANTAIFSTVHEVLLRALPYDDPDRLVMIWEDASFASFPRNTPAPPNYFDWRRLNRSFTDVAATRGLSTNLTADGPPEQILGRGVTASFFPVLGVRPILGRSFTEDEVTTGAPVVVISYRLWQRRYAGAAAVIGRTMRMNGNQQTIVGVMPRDFVFRNRDIDFWGPIRFTPAEAANRNSHFLNVVARRRPDVTIEQAGADMNAVAQQLAARFPDSNGRLGAVVVPLAEDLLGNTRLELIVLMAAAGAVLLIACANLASLLLSRAAARYGELAIRIACGATRTRLVRQLVMEALPLSLAGGALGLFAAPIGAALLARLVPTTLAAPETSVLSAPLLAFTAVLSVATGVLLSLVPAIQAGRRSIRDTLQDSGRAAVGTGGKTRDALVVAQVALAFVLLVGATLMLRTLANLQAIDLGFQSDHLLTLRTTLPREKYNSATARAAFYDRVVDGVRVLPGVRQAAYTSTPPFFSIGNTRSYGVDGQAPRPGTGSDALFRVATGDYLPTLGVQLVEGRLFDRTDATDRPPVVVVNDTLARRHWPGASALGHRLRFGIDSPSEPWFTIVGVVKDVHERGHVLEMKPGVYVPFAQAAAAAGTPEYLLVRTAADPLAAAAAIRTVVAGIDPEQPVSAIRTMDQIIEMDVADRQQQFALLGAFAALALVLSALGLYGVLAYGVTQRRREIGLRMALGASRTSVVRLVVTRGVGLTLAGLTVGIGLAIGLTRTIAALLYGVQAGDLNTFATVIVGLVLVALAACSLPALRAVRIDPIRVLRQE